jgi:hypothetical protein
VLLHSWLCSFVKRKRSWKDLACRNDGCRSSAKETAIGARRFVHNELLSINGWMRVCEQRLTTRVEGIADGGARVNCTHRAACLRGYLFSVMSRCNASVTFLVEYQGQAGPSFGEHSSESESP